MNLTDARKTLGLGPDEDPRVHLSEIKVARERIASLVRNAPNQTLADRYQQGLIEFDQALAAIQEHLEASGLAAPPLPFQLPEKEVAPPADSTDAEILPAEEAPPPPPRHSRALSFSAWFFVLLIGAAGGTWLYLQTEQSKKDLLQKRLIFLERQGSILIENRRWPEAEKAFEEAESLSPGSQIAKIGRRSIEAGIAEEQTQFISYWNGQALAELEAGRLDDATSAARQVLDKFPHNPEADNLIKRIDAARITQQRSQVIAAARAELNQRKWEAAIQIARKVIAGSPDDSDAKSIIEEATAAMEKVAADQAKASALLKDALARDQGQFDQQALDWLREAKSLDPSNPEIATLLEKFSSYTRTLRVPEDFATPTEALAAAHDRDRVILGPQTWTGPLVITKAVDLQGNDSTKTLVECSPEHGSAIIIEAGAKGARISGITFRHESFAVGADRFSAGLVRGGTATFVDCRFTEASGHGLAVIEKGSATAEKCRFSDNGWNGAAAIGEGVSLIVNDSESLNNFEHGFESWDGAAAAFTNNRCEGNSRNGIHADNRGASAVITGNQLIGNREFGLVLDSAGSGKISGNIARGNLLGGFVVRLAASALPVTTNQAESNLGPGLVLEKGLPSAPYLENSLSKNTEPQLLSEANLSQTPEPPAAEEQAAPAQIAPRATVIPEPAGE
jgi:parallel beta-helix repeat protein